MAGNFKASDQLRAPKQTLIMKRDLIISENNNDEILVDFVFTPNQIK